MGSELSHVALYRRMKNQSTAKSRNDLQKELVRFFSQRTLISKLVGKADRERMVKGKAVLHLIGGKQKCTPVLAAPVPGASDPGAGAGARASAYKSADVARSTHTPPSTVRRSSSSKQPPSARSQQQVGEMSEEPKFPPEKHHIYMSHNDEYPKAARTHACGINFGDSMVAAKWFMSQPAHRPLEKLFEAALEAHRDGDVLSYLHEAIGEATEVDEVLCEDWCKGCTGKNDVLQTLHQYSSVLFSTLTSAKDKLTEKEFSPKMRFTLRANGKLLQGLSDVKRRTLEEQAQLEEEEEDEVLLAEMREEMDEEDYLEPPFTQKPACTSTQKPAASSEASGSKPTASGEACGSKPTASSEACGSKPATSSEKGGSKRGRGACKSDGPPAKIQKRSTSTSSVASIASEASATAGEDAGEVETEEERAATQRKLAKARASLANHSRKLAEAGVKSEDMDSDSEEEETPIVASRFAAYANRAFTFGPIVPKTPQYMIIGAVPASDASAKTEKKKMEAFTEAVSAGDKSAKALAAFSTGEVQRNFRPGALAFSWAVRHLNKESQKVVDPFNPAQMVEFKHVNPYSDSQFRYRTWGGLLAKFAARGLLPKVSWYKGDEEEAVALDRFVADLWTALPQLVKNEMEEDEKYLGYVARTYAKRYIRHNGAKPHMWNPNHKNAEKESE